jgi:hypothetical protein
VTEDTRRRQYKLAMIDRARHIFQSALALVDQAERELKAGKDIDEAVKPLKRLLETIPTGTAGHERH